MAVGSSGAPLKSEERAVLRLLRRSFGLAAIAICGEVVALTMLYGLYNRSLQSAHHSHEVDRVTDSAREFATDRQIGVTRYMHTGAAKSAAQARDAAVPLAAALGRLAGLTAADPVEAKRVRRLLVAIADWDRALVAPALAVPVAGAPMRRRDLDALARDTSFDDVRAAFADMIAHENALLTVQVARVAALRRSVVVSAVVEAVLLIWVLMTLRRHILAQLAQLVAQRRQIEDRAMELGHQADEARALAEQLEAANGEMVRSAGVAEHATSLLESEREFLRQVLDINPNFVFAKDRDGRFTLVNQAVADAYGTSIRELVGKTDADFNPNREEIDAFRRADLEVMDTLSTLYVPEERITDSMGAIRWLQTVKRPIVGPTGHADQVLGVSTDITDRKRLEAQLLQAQKMEAVGRLAGGIAHDFNNLLTVISSYAALLLEALGPDDARTDDAAEIKKAADRAARLTSQLLAFSRKQVTQTRVLDLNGVIRELDSMLRRLISEDIDLDISTGPGEMLVSADPGQVEQVIVNLAVNARDAMPNGGRLTISTASADIGSERGSRVCSVPPGEYALITVCDTGSGMDADTMAHLFEPFFTTKGPGKGTGLGLSMVYGIVKQAGGDLRVHSEPGAGTVVKIYLPRLPAAAPEVELQNQRNGDGARGTETILLVEDDPALRVLAHRVLATAGYTVLSARDGEEAIAICRRHPARIDLLATDVVMPGMNGPALVEQLEVLEPGLRVLYISGYTADDVVRRGIENSHTVFLAKPFTPEVLAEKVREALGAGAHETETATTGQ